MIDERMVIQQLFPWSNPPKKKKERNKNQDGDTHRQYQMPPHRSNEEEKEADFMHTTEKNELANLSTLSSPSKNGPRRDIVNSKFRLLPSFFLSAFELYPPRKRA